MKIWQNNQAPTSSRQRLRLAERGRKQSNQNAGGDPSISQNVVEEVLKIQPQRPFLMSYFGLSAKYQYETRQTDEDSKQNNASKNRSVDLSDIYQIIEEGLFEIWNEISDAALYYFPTIPSHTDIDLLNWQMRRRKIMGLFLILNVLNIANLVLPDYYCVDVEAQDSAKIWMWGYQNLYTKCIVNLICEVVIFVFTFYFCFCSQLLPMKLNTDRMTLIGCIMLQYIMGMLFSFYPNIFMFQFYVNVTVMFTLVVKEVILNKKLLWVLLGNTFAVNYLAMHSLKYHPFASTDTSILGALLGYDELVRAHIFALVGTVLQIVQIKSLNRCLKRMLVSKINAMQQTLDIKDTYNASMIHELRNPLNAIIGSIGLLKYSKTLSKEDVETLNIASVSGEILITFINNALDGAKIEANKLELDYNMNDVVEVLTKSVSLFSWKAREKKVSIQLKIAKKMPEQVELDDARLTQVLVNLVGNAVKFTPANGNIKVRARFIAEEDRSSKTDVRKKDSFKKTHYFRDKDEFLEGRDRQEEQDLFEEKFFYNKDIVNELQISDDADLLKGLSSSMIIPEATGGINVESPVEVQHHQFEQLVEDSQQQAYLVDTSIDNSFQSQINNAAGSSDEFERTVQVKMQMLDREFAIKNSFHEWTQGSRITTRQSNFQMESARFNNGIEEAVIERQNESQSMILNEDNSEINPQIGKTFKRKIDHDLTGPPAIDSMGALSEMLKDYERGLSLDSSMLPEQANSRVYSNSTSSNHNTRTVLQQPKKSQKSKFFKDSGVDSERNIRPDANFDFGESVNEAQSNNKFSITGNMTSEQRSKRQVHGRMIIEVIDSGIGISQEGIKKLFKPFSQADKTIQTRYGGTGLGLWISNKIVALMNGTISVVSELNKGTVFIIEIPVNAETSAVGSDNQNHFYLDSGHSNFSEDMTPASLSKSGADTPASRYLQQLAHKPSVMQSELKVLLYQHDDVMQNLFKKYLQKHKIFFNCASNMKELLNLLKLKQFIACFVDIDVNVKSEDLEKLVSVNEKLRSEEDPYKCRIYCFYSRDIDRTKTRFLQRNHVHCVKKPIQGQQLIKYIRRIKNSDFESEMLKMKRKSDAVAHIERQRSLNKDPSSTLAHRGFDMLEQFKNRSPTMDNIEEHRGSNFGLNPTNLRRLIQSKFKLSPPISGSSQGLQNYELPNHRVSDSTLGYYEYPHEVVDEEDYQEQVEQLPVKNKHIERLKRNEFSGNNLDESRRSNNPASSSDMGGSNSDHTSKDHSQFTLGDGDLLGQSDHQRTLPHYEEEKHPSSNSYNSYYRNVRQTIDPSNFMLRTDFDDDEEEKDKNYLETPQFNQSQINSSQVNSNSGEVSSNTFSNRPATQRLLIGEPQSVSSRSKAPLTKGLFPSRQISAELAPLPLTLQIESIYSQSILIVDDDNMNIMILERMLEFVPAVSQWNLKVITATNGLEGLNAYTSATENSSVRLVLMDCEMNIMDGYESTSRIREFEKDMRAKDSLFKNAVIVGLSGNQGEVFQRKCKQCGMDQSMTKPIAMDQLKKIIDRVIN